MKYGMMMLKGLFVWVGVSSICYFTFWADTVAFPKHFFSVVFSLPSMASFFTAYYLVTRDTSKWFQNSIYSVRSFSACGNLLYLRFSR